MKIRFQAFAFKFNLYRYTKAAAAAKATAAPRPPPYAGVVLAVPSAAAGTTRGFLTLLAVAALAQLVVVPGGI